MIPHRGPFGESRNLESRKKRNCILVQRDRPASLHLLLRPAALCTACITAPRTRTSAGFKPRQLTCRSAASICVSLPSFLMNVQRGERKSIIYGVFIWSFMLELKTDEELKRWPDFGRRPFRKKKKKRRKESAVKRLNRSLIGSPLVGSRSDKEKHREKLRAPA